MLNYNSAFIIFHSSISVLGLLASVSIGERQRLQDSTNRTWMAKPKLKPTSRYYEPTTLHGLLWAKSQLIPTTIC